MHGLNPPQQAAVDYLDGPLLVLAGAGSGKTRVITEKIAHLIARRGMDPQRIAAITFTNKAAREMRERVAQRLPGDRTEGLLVSTFHSLGLRFLQIEHERAGLRRGFSIFDTDDANGVLRDLLPRGSKPDAVDALRNLISRAKNEGLDPEGAMQAARAPREIEAATLYALYQARLNAFNAVDFDDLIRLPLALLESDPDCAGGWRERLHYLLVDEYQDTNTAQYRLLRALAGPRGAFTAVGDDDQSIYAWRGANPENLDQLGVDYPTLKVVKLEQNYRCSARILRSANALIANNPHQHLKQLWSTHPDGPPIRVLACDDDQQESERVASEIRYLRDKHGCEWSEFAILFRGNHQSRVLEKSLQVLQVPYHLSGGTAFLERAEVKDMLAWLRLVANPDDDAAFLRAVQSPRRDVGATTLARLGELAGQRGTTLARAAASMDVLRQLTPRAASALDGFTRLLDGFRDHARRLTAAELSRLVAEQSGLVASLREGVRPDQFERRRANLDELAEWFEAARGGGAAGELVAQLALLTHADRDRPGNAVRMMSLHASKGLEFRFVFIVGVEDGLLPHEASIDEGRLDEERRLMYVGITRAKEQLTLSHARVRRRFGDTLKVKPSRFLDELPAAELHRAGQEPDKDAERSREVAGAHLARMAALFKD